jgi:hypothetical protein
MPKRMPKRMKDQPEGKSKSLALGDLERRANPSPYSGCGLGQVEGGDGVGRVKGRQEGGKEA